MLKLTDAELAILRLTCWMHVTDHYRSQGIEADGHKVEKKALGVVDWCLQPRRDGE